MPETNYNDVEIVRNSKIQVSDDPTTVAAKAQAAANRSFGSVLVLDEAYYRQPSRAVGQDIPTLAIETAGALVLEECVYESGAEVRDSEGVVQTTVNLAAGTHLIRLVSFKVTTGSCKAFLSKEWVALTA